MSRGERHRRAVAVHEAGHAIACLLLDVPVESITIAWSGTSHGALVYAGSPPPETLLFILLAGDVAAVRADETGWLEEAHGDSSPAPPESADVKVTSDAEKIEVLLEALHPGDTSAQDRLLGASRERVSLAVEQHWAAITRVAAALLQKTSLNGCDVRRIVETTS